MLNAALEVRIASNADMPLLFMVLLSPQLHKCWCLAHSWEMSHTGFADGF